VANPANTIGYLGLAPTSRDRELGFIPLAGVLDILENRLTILARALLARGMAERDADFLRGQAKEVSLLLEALKSGTRSGD
jgi:hypothetical protein